MKKIEFLNTLQNSLEKRRVHNIPEIMADYEEHFSHGLGKGLSEEEISGKLGSPSQIAAAYETDLLINEVSRTGGKFNPTLALRVIGRLLLLAPFNLIVLFIPGMIVFAMLTAGWSVSFAMGAIALAALKNCFLMPGILVVLAMGSAGVGLLGFMTFLAVIMFYLTKYILLAIINYLKWNLQFVLDKKRTT